MVALNSLAGQGADRNVFSKSMSNVLPKPDSVPSFILTGAFSLAITSLHSTDKDPFIDHHPADRCACTRAPGLPVRCLAPKECRAWTQSKRDTRW